MVYREILIATVENQAAVGRGITIGRKLAPGGCTTHCDGVVGSTGIGTQGLSRSEHHVASIIAHGAGAEVPSLHGPIALCQIESAAGSACADPLAGAVEAAIEALGLVASERQPVSVGSIGSDVGYGHPLTICVGGAKC